MVFKAKTDKTSLFYNLHANKYSILHLNINFSLNRLIQKECWYSRIGNFAKIMDDQVNILKQKIHHNIFESSKKIIQECNEMKN